jgi:hypothetical protein
MGESFIYCGWEDEKYRTVFLNKKQEPDGSTTLGCIKIPADKTKLYDNIYKIVKIPFRAAPWQFDDIYLGINETHLNMLKIFMEEFYDKDFAEQVFNQFESNLKEYKDLWLLYAHETRFFNYLFERNNLYTLKVIQKVENFLKKILKYWGI